MLSSPDDLGIRKGVTLIVIVAVALISLIITGAFAYNEYRYMTHGVKVRVEIRDRTQEMTIVKSSEKAVGYFLYFYTDQHGESHLRKFSLATDLVTSATNTPDHQADAYYLDDFPTESELAVEREPGWIVGFLASIGVLAIAGVYFAILVVPREIFGGTPNRKGGKKEKSKSKKV